MRMVIDQIDAPLADTGHDADAIRAKLAAAKFEAIMPDKANRRNPAPHDRRITDGATASSGGLTSFKTQDGLQPATTRPPDAYIDCVSFASALLWPPCLRSLARLSYVHHSINQVRSKEELKPVLVALLPNYYIS